jgi:hypothetical protein
MAKVMLRDLAHSRAGDKGNISNISVIAYQMKDYPMLKEKVTAEAVKDYFKGICHGSVARLAFKRKSKLIVKKVSDRIR